MTQKNPKAAPAAKPAEAPVPATEVEQEVAAEAPVAVQSGFEIISNDALEVIDNTEAAEEAAFVSGEPTEREFNGFTVVDYL